MIRITIKEEAGRPHVILSHHVTGERYPFGGYNMLFHTKPTGNWRGKGQPYFTVEDRQHMLNEARQWADGFAAGVAYASSQISRVDDNQPVIEFKPDVDFVVRRQAESREHGEGRT